jgi:hypothetical protein
MTAFEPSLYFRSLFLAPSAKAKLAAAAADRS